MNYKKIYDNLMLSRIAIKENRILEKKNGKYYERHHIIPLSLGGNKSYSLKSDNIVLLTAREHYLAHRMLWLIYRNREMGFAFHKMVFSNNHLQKRNFSSKEYEAAKLAFSECQRGRNGTMYGKGEKLKGKKRSPEFKELMRIQKIGKYHGEDNPFYGKTHSLKFKNKMSNIASLKKGSKNPNYNGKKYLYDGRVFLGEYENSNEIGAILGCSVQNINKAIRSGNKVKRKYNIYLDKQL